MNEEGRVGREEAGTKGARRRRGRQQGAPKQAFSLTSPMARL